MPVIVEEDESNLLHPDITQLLDLPETTLAESTDGLIGSIGEADASHVPTSLPEAADWPNGFLGDWDLPEANPDALTGLEEPDYSKFENWIPLFYRPEKPCDYCRSRRLQCYVQRGEDNCTPCKSLFRECSMSKSNTLEATNYVDTTSGTFLDTLHAVDEDLARERGHFTGIKALRSKGASGTITPSRVPVRDDAPGSSKRNGIRFPRHAVKTLREWLESHTDNPYPTEEEKAELEKQTELKPAQIANWLANARRRRKITEKARPRLCMSPSLRPSSPAIPIPCPQPDKPWDELNPFERWKNSPPEHEPASMTDIANAVAESGLEEGRISTSPSTLSRRGKGSSNGSGFSNFRAPSTTSQETGQTSSLSASSAAISGSSHSHSTHGSFGSFSSSLAGKKDRRRRRRPATTTAATRPGNDKKRIFQCTFCTDTFRSKYDWTRHEKSLHLSLEKWVCAPYGPIVTDEQTGVKTCNYCGVQDPSDAHVETHNHRQCEDKGLDARTFYRKDHLRQHLRLMHGCEMMPRMDNWKFIAVSINSRCGFCAQRFTIWQERVDHLTAHFKAGARMSEWKGCRGLDPAVAAQVTNAMPPYLIGIESVSLNPFSATNRATWRQDGLSENGDAPAGLGNLITDSQQTPQRTIDSMGTRSTCWEVLTVRLGRYAKQMAEKGVVMTDEMLQAQAREILYGSDDSWNQTAADNPEWLDLFKKAHGLDFIPNAIGGQGSAVPEDLETYGDLGLRIPFAVQLQAYSQSQNALYVPNCADSNKSANLPGPFKREVERRKATLREVYSQLAHEGVLYDDDQKCQHSECAKNVIDATMVDADTASDPQMKRWCRYAMSDDKVKQLDDLITQGSSWSPTDSSTTETGQNSPTSGVGTAKSLQPREPIDPDLIAARARTRGLLGLARVEAPILDDCVGATTATKWAPAKKPGVLPYHRHELPKDRAVHFETVTGAWEESGRMPQPFQTSVPSIDREGQTSTGAMMEFLGGNVGSSLPFSRDAQTSDIPLVDPMVEGMPLEGQEWQLADGGTISQEALMDQLDELIQTTTAAEVADISAPATVMDVNWTTGEMLPTVMAGTGTDLDLNMEDLNFDDSAFDGVFDMTLDDALNDAE